MVHRVQETNGVSRGTRVSATRMHIQQCALVWCVCATPILSLVLLLSLLRGNKGLSDGAKYIQQRLSTHQLDISSLLDPRTPEDPQSRTAGSIS
jgi:hypothetical protein